jgi:multiple sugar transport system substrate-binding protein
MVTRRNFLRSAASIGGVAVAAQLPVLKAFANDEAMRLFWFGSAARVERTNNVVKLFEAANQGVKIVGEVGGNYWSKLTTMLAGGNAPDVFQLAPSRFADFARRNALLPLDDLLGKTIRTDKLMPDVFKLGTVDGKVTGVPLGINAFALLYDTVAFEQAGIAPPSANTNWDDFARLCVDLTKAMGKQNVWAVSNCARYSYAFESFLVQRGKRLYLDNGQIGFDANDAKDWYGYWDNLAKAGGCVPADIQAMDKLQIDSSPLTTGNAVMTIAFSNQLLGYQMLAKNPLGITSLPIISGGPSGLFYKASLHFSIAHSASDPEFAARFLDFFINDMEAGKLLGVERGVPVNLEVREAVAPTVDEVSKRSLDYITSIADRVGAFPPQVPVGASELEERVYRSIADKVLFGQMSVAEAGDELVAQANRILKR